MNSTSARDLILSAAGALKPHTVGDRLFGNVASELVASSGTRYQGVCIDQRSAPLRELLPAHDWPLPLDLG